jgi:phosphohistidine phosphatase
VKVLGLLRHAKSDWDDLTLRDFDRGLNGRGRAGAALMGAHIRDLGVGWDAVLASPAQRVKLTLEASGLDLPVTYAEDAYMGDAATLIDLIGRHGGDTECLLLAAHNPGLQELVLQLVPPDDENALFEQVLEKFPTAAFAMLELAIDRWEDCVPGCGRLTHFARPRDLDPQLGPEKVS